MHRSLHWLIALGTVLSVVMTTGAIAQQAVTVERRPYRQWANAIHLTNSEVEVVVVPQIGGRIMRYAKVGGENLLWENATASRRDVWPNWGGDKVWVWPQDGWHKGQGTDWPPPIGADQGEYAVEISGDVVTLTSPLVEGYGVRVQRAIRLAQAGTELSIENRLLPVEGAATAGTPIAAWTITQLPKPETVFARGLDSSTLAKGYRLMMPNPWDGIETTDDGITQIPMPRNHHKIGLDADALATKARNGTFIQRDVTTPVGSETPEPGDRAQVYVEADIPRGRDASTGAYIELEFTGLRKDASASPALKLVWSISEASPSEALRATR